MWVVVVLLLLFVVPLAGTGLYIASRTMRDMEEHELARYRVRARTVAALVEREFASAQRLLLSVSDRRLFTQAWEQSLRRGDTSALERHLEDILQLEPAFLFASVYTPEGTLRAIVPPDPILGENYAHRDWYRGVTSTGRPYVSEVYRTAAAPNPLVVAVAVPLTGADGQMNGILMAPYTLDALAAKLATLEAGAGGELVVFDQRGIVAARPGIKTFAAPQSAAEAGLFSPGAVPVPATAEGSARLPRSRTPGVPGPEETRLAAWAPAPALGWTVVYSHPRRSALAPVRALARDALRGTLYLTVIYLGTLVVVGVLIRRQSRLLEAAERADAALRESERRYRLFFESSPQPMWLFDLDTLAFIAVNDAALRQYGYSREEFLGMKVTDIRPPEDVPALLAHLRGRAPQLSPGAQPGVWRHRRKDGSLVDAEIFSHHLDYDGRRASLVLATDVTERLRAQRRVDRFFELSVDLLCIAGFDGRFQRVNRAFESVLGYTPEELLSRPYLDFVHPEDVEATRQQAARLAQGQPALSFANRYRAKDGSYRTLVWNASSVVEDEVIYAVARDATERLRAEAELQRLYDDLRRQAGELEAVNAELEAFTYSVSHDLRAPLRQVDGFARILAEEYAARLDERGRHYLQRVRDGARHMGMLVDDLLNLSRVSRAELKLQAAPLGPIVEEVIASLAAETDGRAIAWRVDPLPAAECDPALVRQVFANLLANAVKFTAPRERAEIHVGSTAAGGETAFFVEDNGVGFDMKYADKLFGVFQRLHRAEDFEGTGIGLATVQRIVHKHGGRVWAESQPDRGARFFFTLSGPQEREGLTSGARQHEGSL